MKIFLPPRKYANPPSRGDACVAPTMHTPAVGATHASPREHQHAPPARKFAAILLALAALALGCDNMRDQARYNTESKSEFYADGASARPIVGGTVVHGRPRPDTLLYTGKINGQLADVFPFVITAADLRRGQERYTIFCSMCHGGVGDGKGMIALRGFVNPPSYHIPRLRKAPVGHFFDVITNGWGAMYSYNARVGVRDRWRIAAYIRALQLSQNAPASVAPAGQMRQLQETQP